MLIWAELAATVGDTCQLDDVAVTATRDCDELVFVNAAGRDCEVGQIGNALRQGS